MIFRYSPFWSTINVDLAHSAQDLKVAYWLKYAGSQLLSITISDSHDYEDEQWMDGTDTKAYCCRVGVALREGLDRWLAFVVAGSVREVEINTILRFCSGYSPNLQRIEINRKQADEQNAIITLPFVMNDVFHPSPNSELVVSVKVYIPSFPGFGGFITDLHLSYTSLDLDKTSIYDILSTCSNLIRFAVWFARFIESSPIVINLQHLTYLYASQVENVHFLLESLRMPSLRSIELRGDWCPEFVVAVYRTFEQCQLLETVILTAFKVDEASLQGFPNLEPLQMGSLLHLTVNSSNPVNPLFECLLIPNAIHVKLRHISFSVVAALLSTTRELRRVSLRSIDHVPGIYSPIHLPSVTKLTIYHSSWIHLHLETPCLEELYLCHPTLTTSLGLGPSPSSYRNLIELEMSSKDYQEDDLVQYFRVMPHLERLTLTFGSASGGVLRTLSLPPPGRRWHCAPSPTEDHSPMGCPRSYSAGIHRILVIAKRRIRRWRA